MIPKTKFGDCSNENCDAKNTECIKVGKYLFCLKCRNKAKQTLSKSATKKVASKLYKQQKENGSSIDAERSFLIQDLDVITSKYVRLKDANNEGIVSCFTCDWRGSWKDLDCGHYIVRSKMLLRWDLRNLRPQCKTCNQLNYGEVEKFAINLEKENPGIVEALLEQSRITCKWSRSELKELLLYMRGKLKLIEFKMK